MATEAATETAELATLCRQAICKRAPSPNALSRSAVPVTKIQA
jgi:hypothetical protein